MMDPRQFQQIQQQQQSEIQLQQQQQQIDNNQNPSNFNQQQQQQPDGISAEVQKYLESNSNRPSSSLSTGAPSTQVCFFLV